MINIKQIRALCHDDTIIATKHFTSRLSERNIEYSDILLSVMNGKIIEEYPTSYPYPCALILNFVANNKPLHVVVGTNGDSLWLITAYFPNLDEWNEDYETRKAVE